MARDTTLSALAAYERRSADAGDPGSSCKVWAVRLPAHHGAVAECGMAGGQGSSAADLATRRAESAAEAAATRAVVARGWFVCAVAPRAGESCVELRFREGDDARWTGAARPGGDRRVHAGVFGAAGGAAFGKLAGDRNVGGCDVGARDTLRDSEVGGFVRLSAGFNFWRFRFSRNVDTHCGWKWVLPLIVNIHVQLFMRWFRWHVF